jgi:dTDP-4-amino-4,6-dideoxygalactose transaminase
MPELAIHGGTPVRTAPYPDWPVFDERDVEAVADVVRSGVWGGHPAPGPKAAEFLEKWAAYQGAKYGVLVMNGTITLKLALEALGIGWRDEVIVPAITFSATYYACIVAGAIPVPVDVNEEHIAIDCDQIEAAVTERTRAIIPVHLGQHMADMDRVMEVARRHDLAVIEDAAHAHGQQWQGRGAGCIGDFGSFSHQSTKTLNAGEGGSLLTNDEDLALRVLSLTDCGRRKGNEEDEAFTYSGNFRLGEVNAVLLSTQLDKFEEQRRAREEAMRHLEEIAADIPGINVLAPDERLTRRCCYQYIISFDPESLGGAQGADVCHALSAEGIPCWQGFPSITDYELFKPSLSRLPVAVEFAERVDPATMIFPVADGLTRRMVWLDHVAFLDGEQGVEDIADALRKVQSNVGELSPVS